jgi:hypothetical protein
MRQQEAIRIEHEALERLARLSEELAELDKLIFWFGQARYYNPTMVRRLSRTRERLLAERTEEQERRREAAKHI